MTHTQQEALAGLRILVRVAMADGLLTPVERQTLMVTLHQGALAVSLESLLNEKDTVADILPLITTPAIQQAVYDSAYTLAHSDGHCSPEEEFVLERIRLGYSLTFKSRVDPPLQGLARDLNVNRKKSFIAVASLFLGVVLLTALPAKAESASAGTASLEARVTFLNAIKDTAREDGSMTEALAQGQVDGDLIALGTAVCQAHSRGFAQEKIVAFVTAGACKCTPAEVLLTTMAAAELYLCPEFAS